MSDKITLDQAAEMIGLHKSTVYRFIKLGLFPSAIPNPIKTANQLAYWDKEEALAGIEKINEYKRGEAERRSEAARKYKLSETTRKHGINPSLYNSAFGLMAVAR